MEKTQQLNATHDQELDPGLTNKTKQNKTKQNPNYKKHQWKNWEGSKIDCILGNRNALMINLLSMMISLCYKGKRKMSLVLGDRLAS